MTTTSSPSPFQTIRGRCPATGRSASVCADQSHGRCYQGARESATLDRRVETAFRRMDRSY